MNKDDNMVELHYKNLSLDNIAYLDDNGVECTEVWKDVPDYEGYYQVSDLGRVKSFKKKFPYIMSQYLDIYYSVTFGLNNIRRTFRIHQLVCIAFLGHKPDGTQKVVVDHKNNEKIDNRLTNLQLINQRKNASKDKSSYYLKCIGISYCDRSSKWKSRLRINGKLIHLGVFTIKEEAYKCYKNAVEAIENGEEIKYNIKEKNSKFKGISYCKRDRLWIAFYYSDKKSKRLGGFKTEQEAFEARENYIKNLNLQV